MNKAEDRVLSLINNSKDPALALDVALKLILEFLEPLQASECKPLEPRSAIA